MSIFDISLQYNQNMDSKLQQFIEKDNCYFIHYANDGFYSGTCPAPRISCIVLYNLKTDKCVKFSIADHLDNDFTNVGLAEEEIFSDLYVFLKEHPNISFIHWNMQANGFGFKAIQARADKLGFDFPIPDNDHLFDLSSYVAYVAEKKLSIKQVLWFNSLLIGDDYLDGKTEAEYFNKGKFKEIFYSVDLKVRGFADVVKLIQEDKLKSEPPYQINDGLTKEERRQQALKIAAAREEMLRDMVNHNKRILNKKEKAFDDYLKNADKEVKAGIDRYFDKNGIEYEEEYYHDEGIFFFSFAHPIISLFANWFANRK